MSETQISRVEHAMTRLNIRTGVPFDEFRTAFESRAPVFDPTPYFEIVRAGGSWDDVKAQVAACAPYDLMIYAIIDATPMMMLAGNRGHAVEYLLGNHVIAETMYRRDPNALLYAPLRVLLFSDNVGHAIFSIDQPSTVFAGLNDSDIAAIGVLLDHKVTELLRGIGVRTEMDLIRGNERD